VLDQELKSYVSFVIPVTHFLPPCWARSHHPTGSSSYKRAA